MIEITFEKGVITFMGRDRKYAFNINNGELVNQKTQKQIQNTPFTKNELYTAIKEQYPYQEYVLSSCRNVIAYMGYTLNSFASTKQLFNDEELLKTFQFYDRIYNALPENYFITSYLTYFQVAKLEEKEISCLCSYLAKLPPVTTKTLIRLSDTLTMLQIEKFIKQYHLPEDIVKEYYLNWQHYYNSNPIKYAPYLDILIYYFFVRKVCCFPYAGEAVFNYVDWCIDMKKEPKKQNDFIREYVETQRAYDLWKENSKTDRFMAVYEKYGEKLKFDDGDFTVVLPQVPQDLVTEGNNMHHCVGGYIERVCQEKHLIVFVRRKTSPDQCYITADINPKNGKIGQYFLAFDRNISSDEDIEFKKAFQKHLNSFLW